QCEFLALHGVSLLIKTIELVKKRLNPVLSITGVIPCMYDVRKGLARDVVVEIERHFGDKVTKTKIRSNVRLAEAPSHGKSIFDYAPESYGAEDYLALAREVVGIEMIERTSPYVPASVYTPSPVAPASQVEIKPLEAPPPAPAPEPNSADKVFGGEPETEPLPVAPTDVPLIESAAPSPPMSSPIADAAVEESLVEFIELIPLEIE